jgi:putative intracellular protease/amidase
MTRITIPLFDRFTALDAVGPYEVLSRLPGAEVTFAAATTEPVQTDTRALTVIPSARLADIDACEILVVPGGPGTRSLMTDTALTDWVKRIDTTTTWTTSVCTGSLVLGAAGLLTGRPATTHWGAVELLESLGARYTDQRVVRDGKIITAAGVSSGIDMALTLAALVAGEDLARAIQLSIEYDPQPPFDSGSVAKAGDATVALVRRVMAARQTATPAAAPTTAT